MQVPETGDTSKASTDQSVKKKNQGSGESLNNKCGQNLIKAGADFNCQGNNFEGTE
jgi:hypothetical protein